MSKNLIFVELNELNFDAVRYYIDKKIRLPGFTLLFEKGLKLTHAEPKYQNLEPWIQWPSVHTGKTYDEHNVFRLGDFVNSSREQIFEKVERAGFSVGAISPMNASNKLHAPAYFIPDPWTQTPCDDSFISKAITQAIVQAVNDNSQSKLTLKTMFNLVLAFVALVTPLRFFPLAMFAMKSFGKPWRKALFLDLLLYEFHKTLFKKKKPNFSTLFLNAGAHIQHHYFFNSPFVDDQTLKNPNWYVGTDEDPFLEMVKVYDKMILDILSLSDTELIIATGLSQKPFEKPKFYYRLKDHKAFLNVIGIDFKDVMPRMTRDFLISFDSVEQASIAEKKLSKILVNDGVKMFSEIDNRGQEIFVVLTYPSEIKQDTMLSISGKQLSLVDFVTFVAIKNGEHQSKGFAYFSDEISKYAPPQDSHVSRLHNTVLDFFGVPR